MRIIFPISEIADFPMPVLLNEIPIGLSVNHYISMGCKSDIYSAFSDIRKSDYLYIGKSIYRYRNKWFPDIGKSSVFTKIGIWFTLNYMV